MELAIAENLVKTKIKLGIKIRDLNKKNRQYLPKKTQYNYIKDKQVQSVMVKNSKNFRENAWNENTDSNFFQGSFTFRTC